MTPSSLTLDDVRQAAGLPEFDVHGAWRRMAPVSRPLDRPPEKSGTVRPAGVLILLYPHQGRLHFALTRRTETVSTHKGQISLPGGAQEAGETPGETALRETCEEIGVCEGVELIGALTPLYIIVSDFEIHPFIGFLPERPAFHPDPVEVAEVLEMPLDDLINDSIKETERWSLHGMELDVTFYRLGDHPVWGATAIILSEMESRLRAAITLR
jgi:8-oxo-dGTP pyrophosphatase MutT (NUDIX family)